MLKACGVADEEDVRYSNTPTCLDDTYTIASWTNERINELAKVLKSKIKSKYAKLSHSALGIKCSGFIKCVMKWGVQW